jgi:hypothetical protein
MGGVIRGLGAVAEIVGGAEDHVHLLAGFKTTDAPADMVRELKKASSGWIAQRHDSLFAWQEGYSIFSISWTHKTSVYRYIEQQEAHHRKNSFLDELRRLLNRNGVKYDPAYLR